MGRTQKWRFIEASLFASLVSGEGAFLGAPIIVLTKAYKRAKLNRNGNAMEAMVIATQEGASSYRSIRISHARTQSSCVTPQASRASPW